MESSILPIASGERAGAAQVELQAKLLEGISPLVRILDAVPSAVMILNRERQVVLANQSLVRLAGTTTVNEVRGLRPGELLECVHSSETPNGCGTSESCSVCGAVRAIVTAHLGRADTRDCRITRRTGAGEEPLELEISATPLEISGHPFTLVCAVNAADRVRRQWFERAVVPQAVVLATELEVLAATLASPNSDPTMRGQTAAILFAASRRLSSLLRELSEMAEAEAGECRGVRGSASTLELLSTAAREVQENEAAQNRQVRLDPAAEDLGVATEPVLARRVLAKMLLNALEATPTGGTVSLGCRSAGDQAELWIRNAGEIPRRIQLQIFQRSFSTKGPGRGYGTYFMKLMTERCLGGTISFQSNAEEGTTFAIRLPLAEAEEAGQ